MNSIDFRIGLLAAFGCGMAALYFGQDANWDLRNYHFYIPYAFLEGRFDLDIAPAQVASFYNPFLYVPFYYAVTLFPPKVLGAFIGMIQGMNGVFLAKIARSLDDRNDVPPSEILIPVAVCLTGAGFISEIGTSFADTVLSIPVLAALWLNIAATRKLHLDTVGLPWKEVLLSGLLMGLTAGLKQPTVVFAVGLCSAFLFLGKNLYRNILIAFLFGLGVLTGITITGGYWMFELWSRFKNPLFPYFNDLFKSPWAAAGNYRDSRFLPNSLSELMVFPFFFAFSPLKTAEIQFTDFRLLLLYALSVSYGFYRLTCKKRQNRSDNTTDSGVTARYFFIFILISFLVWIKLFGIYRYLIVLEMLAPLGICWIVQRHLGHKPICRIVTVSMLLFLFLTTIPGTWDRVSWGDDYFGVTPPKIKHPENTLVLMTGNDPMAYMIPFFPKSIRFLRIQSYFTGPSDLPNQFDNQMKTIVRTHSGPIFVLFRSYEKKETVTALQAYNVTLDESQCETLTPHIESHLKFPLLFCRLRSTTESGITPKERKPAGDEHE